jgi:DNA-binding MarR family transcriptional regulator
MKIDTRLPRSIGKEIGFLGRSAHIYFQHRFKNYSIGHAQVMTLHFIGRNEGITQKELVDYFSLDKSSVTSQLKKLEENGYIVREKVSGDHRVRIIRLTEKSRVMKDELNEVFASWSRLLLKDFTPEETEQIFALLDKMKGNVCEIYKQKEKRTDR